MQVVIEYALAENFCMDFTLLLSAKSAVKNPASYFRLSAASAFGALFAVIFPFFSLTGAAAVAVKLAAGLALCAVAGKFSSFKGYARFALAFTALTFASGGAIFALFSLANVSYGQSGGVIISSVPVGIPLCFGALICIAVKKMRGKFTGSKLNEASIKIYYGERCAACTGFFDSGNKVYYSGAPVTIIPPHVAKKLVDVKGIKRFVDIHTVSGNSKIPIFTADKAEIYDGRSKTELYGVILGVSPTIIGKAVIHPDLSEVT